MECNAQRIAMDTSIFKGTESGVAAVTLSIWLLPRGNYDSMDREASKGKTKLVVPKIFTSDWRSKGLYTISSWRKTIIRGEDMVNSY